MNLSFTHVATATKNISRKKNFFVKFLEAQPTSLNVMKALTECNWILMKATMEWTTEEKRFCDYLKTVRTERALCNLVENSFVSCDIQRLS